MTLVRCNWLLGQRIAQEELAGANRADYGAQVIKGLSRVLTEEYGKGFTKTNLYTFVQFNKAFPTNFHAVSGKFNEQPKQIFHAASGKTNEEKVYTVCKQSEGNILDAVSLNSEAFTFVPVSDFPNLSWTHYRILLQESNKDAREWYMQEAARETWGTRTLQRNISSQYYYRMLKTYDKEGVHGEMVKLTEPLQDKLEYIKSPVIAEFLGLGQNIDYIE